MEHTLLAEINKKSLQAYVTGRIYEALYWPLFFPLRFSPTMKYEILSGIRGHRVIADVAAFNSPAPEKRRPVITKLEGDIPPILIKRTLDENGINKYNMLKALASSDSQREVMDIVFGDVDACNEGLDGRLEWLALQALSQGSLSLTATNNGAGIITTDTIDFQIPSDNKNVESAADQYWTTGAYATNDPIGDIETIVSEANSAGVKLRYCLMNLTKWQAFRTSTAVQNFVIPFALYGGTKVKRAPSVNVANQALAEEGLPQIVIIDTRVNIENKDHTISAVDPWLNASSEDRNVTFLPDLQAGSMYHGPIAEATNPPRQAIQARRGPFLISKFREIDPIRETTKGQVNAFPGIGNADHMWILDTESHTTFGA